MKKIVTVIMSLILVLGLTACGPTPEQEALIAYVDGDYATLRDLQTEAVTSYNSVVGKNYDNTVATRAEFAGTTLSAAKLLNEKANEVTANITDEGVMEVHLLYVKYTEVFYEGIQIASGTVQGDPDGSVDKVNDYVKAGNDLLMEHEAKLKALAEEYEVDLNW